MGCLEERQYISLLEDKIKSHKENACRREQELPDMIAQNHKNLELLMDKKATSEAQRDKLAHELRKLEDAARDLSSGNVTLQEHRQTAQRQVLRFEEDQQAAQNEARSWYEKYHATNKENVQLQRQNKERTRIVATLEAKLRSKEDKENQSGQSLAQQNSELKKELAKKQMDLELSMRKVRDHDVQLARFPAAH